MSDWIIKAEALGKKYRLRHLHTERYSSLRDVLVSKTKHLFGSKPANHQPELDDFWALRELGFQIQRGEVVGIIGRNGAGKSTLLKILSRITDPTEGRIILRGRIASLLEVGTGFHPELTGRENIFLNGAILGMTRSEIRSRFDEIVAFAEVERFLDTPVKRYSSGMYVRLAFAVAAHLEPEILIVDEVLAVGDGRFQEKCLGKMESAAKRGRTVLFVSHNMATIQHLCSRCILLKDGRIHRSGPPAEVIGEYLSDSQPVSDLDLTTWKDRKGSGEALITRLTIQNDQGEPSTTFNLGSSVSFTLEIAFSDSVTDPCVGIIVHNATGDPILDIRSSHTATRFGKVTKNLQVTAEIPNVGLYPGRYFISPWISDSAISRDIDFPQMCSSIQILPTPGPAGDMKLDACWGKYWVNSIWKNSHSI